MNLEYEVYFDKCSVIYIFFAKKEIHPCDLKQNISLISLTKGSVLRLFVMTSEDNS